MTDKKVSRRSKKAEARGGVTPLKDLGSGVVLTRQYVTITEEGDILEGRTGEPLDVPQVGAYYGFRDGQVGILQTVFIPVNAPERLNELRRKFHQQLVTVEDLREYDQLLIAVRPE